MHKRVEKLVKSNVIISLTLFAFVITGVMLLVFARAAAPSISTEVETGTITAPATTVTDGMASAGKAVQFATPSTTGGGTMSCGTGCQPIGVSGTHTLVFDDEFNGSAIDWNAWSPTSAAEADCGRGDQFNYNNGQAEWSQAYNPNNATETGGLLTFYAKKGNVTGCGHTYTWSSARISSKASYSAGTIIELRFKASGTNATGGDFTGGTWNGYWTWCADGGNGCEVDGYEFWPPTNNTFNLTSHLSTGTGFKGVSVPSITAWHTMAIVLGASSIQWYLDGTQVLSTNGGLPKPINLILDEDVCNGKGCPVPGPSATQAQIQYDYVRIWK